MTPAPEQHLPVHRAGRLPEAIAIYRQILATQPANVAAPEQHLPLHRYTGGGRGRGFANPGCEIAAP
jgi:hypothetical protein